MKLIPLSKTGKHAGKYSAMVDDDMFDYLNQWNWQAMIYRDCVYAKRSVRINGVKKNLYLHRVVVGVSMDDPCHIDHRDRNGLNCQRLNVRTSTPSDNGCNQVSKYGASKYLGVGKKKWRNDFRWYSCITKNGKRIHIWYFKSEEDAAMARDRVAIDVHGEFANLNFPDRLT